MTLGRGPADGLSSTAWDDVQAAAARFEEAWRGGERPDIAALLPADAARRRALLVELAHTELELRLKAGEAARAEDYLARFPELAAEPAAVAGLAAAEYEFRRRREPDLSPDEFRRRFPDHRPEPDGEPTPTHPPGQTPQGPPSVPGYEILGELGRGGMGVVYQARQIGLDRVVALKMIRGGTDAAPEDLARFRAEAEAAARLQHPNIVQVYEVGEHDGLPFFSMEYCPGGGLDRKLQGAPMTPADAARLVETLARAVHAAHRQNVIHRDLKPANVLLAEDGSPKITDFGLAKRLDVDRALSRTGDVMGTPSYMPPEQAAGKVKQVGPAADVYALGAILYECLTGRPPFKAATAMETLLQALHDDPVPPRQLQPKTPRDLETICLKCLRKEAAKRYASAEALAEDLRRFRANEPITARPAGAWERAWKWVRRRPTQAALTAVGGLAAAAGLVLAVGAGFYGRLQAAYHETEQQRDQAVAARKDADQQRDEVQNQKNKIDIILYLMRIERAHSAWREEDVIRAEQILADCAAARRNWEWRYLYRLCRHDLVPFAGHRNGVTSLAYSRDGTRLLTASEDKTARVWDAADGRLLHTLEHPAPVGQAAFSQEGNRVATASWEGGVRVWDLDGGGEPMLIRPVRHVEGKADVPEIMETITFSPDGALVAAAGDGAASVHVWRAGSGTEVQSFPGRAVRLTFSPNGEQLAGAGASTKKVLVWNAGTGRCEHTLTADQAPMDVAFSPDGGRVAAACGGEILVWDLQTEQRVLSIRPRSGGVDAVAFSPDGNRLAGGGRGKVVRVWDATTGVEMLTHVGHHFAVGAVAFSPDGSQLASATGGIGPPGEIKVWDASARPEFRVLPTSPGPGGDLVFSRDGTRLTTSAGKAWSLADGKEVAALPTLGGLRALSADGGRFAIAAPDGIHVWDAVAGRPLLTLPAPALPLALLAFSPDGARLAVGAGKGAVLGPPGAPRPEPPPGELKVWDLNAGPTALSLPGYTAGAGCLAFSPDGSQMAFGSGKELKLWDLKTGQAALALQGDVSHVARLAFSRDGRWVAGGDGLDARHPAEVHVWDAATGERKGDFGGLVGGTTSLVFSPDGTLLAAGSGTFNTPGQVKVWEWAAGKERFSGVCSVICWALAFSPDGTRLAGGGGLLVQMPGEIRLWDTATGQETLILPGHAGQVNALAFSPDGSRLASAGYEGVVKIWDAPPVGPPAGP